MNLLQDLTGNGSLSRREGRFLAVTAQQTHPLEGINDRHRRDLVNGLVGDSHRQRFRTQTFSAANGAGSGRHIVFDLAPHVVAGGLLVATL